MTRKARRSPELGPGSGVYGSSGGEGWRGSSSSPSSTCGSCCTSRSVMQSSVPRPVASEACARLPRSAAASARAYAGLVFGLFLCAVGIVASLESRLGLSPWDVLHQGLAEHTPLTFGVANVVVGMVVLAVAALLGRAHRPRDGRRTRS